MSGQRLIDANAFLQKMMQTNRYFSVKFDVLEAPTIEPETLPIVQDLRSRNKRLKAVVKVQLEQLREKTTEIDELCEKVADLDEKLHRVTAERDAAVDCIKDMAELGNSMCHHCECEHECHEEFAPLCCPAFRYRGLQKEE